MIRGNGHIGLVGSLCPRLSTQVRPCSSTCLHSKMVYEMSGSCFLHEDSTRPIVSCHPDPRTLYELLWLLWLWELFGMMSIFSLYHVSGTLKFSKIGLRCLNCLGIKPILFGNDGKISPGTGRYGVEGSSCYTQDDLANQAIWVPVRAWVLSGTEIIKLPMTSCTDHEGCSLFIMYHFQQNNSLNPPQIQRELTRRCETMRVFPKEFVLKT